MVEGFILCIIGLVLAVLSIVHGIVEVFGGRKVACQDCYCGRKEMEEKGVKATNALCGPDFDALLKAYEEGDLSREEFLYLIKKG